MANCDDPPFLNVGTEVSAKYRGAFCEATIKVAKKLVKCKVSYTKGQTALVNNDVVKGPLKIGSQVEVKQTDGQFLPATINKLTDQSTYTVVFDDGDERTLKRSSLCLKGARHFHESESLDNQPLTDPENFGAPVNLSKKSSRKRRRLSPGSSQEDEVNSKRKFTYPPEFPVGKAVFLENDRRRSCWLPAVIVPAHYVMEESEMTPDTICLRSFKDGRFFAATKNELHDFSPDKEPLLSMLEGEIQAMYMCKPAIERATAYLDTGELPWDMDLFDKNAERPTPLRSRDHASSDKEEASLLDNMAAEREQFMKNYNNFMESRGTPVLRPPIIGQKDLDLYRLYKLVQENGGMERVSQEMKWRSIYLQLGMTPMANASFAINRSYKRYLYSYEMHEKGKGQKPSKDLPNRLTPKRATGNSDEEQQQQQKQGKGDKLAPKMTRNSKVEKFEPKLKMEKISTAEKGPTKPDKQKPVLPKVERVNRSEKPVKLVKQVSKDTPLRETVSEDDDTRSQSTEIKSELSDQDLSAVENSSSNGDEPPDLRQRNGIVHVACPGGYAENDHVLVWYGKGKSLRTYQAKVQGVEESEDGRSYLVHYNGWNNRYDEWIEEQRLAGKVTGEVKPGRPKFSKNKTPKPMKYPRNSTPGSATPPSCPPSSTDSPPRHSPSSPLNGITPVQGSKVREEPPKEPLVKKTPQALVQTPVGVVDKSGGGNSGSTGRPVHRRVKKRKRSQSNLSDAQNSTDGCIPSSPEAQSSEEIRETRLNSSEKIARLSPSEDTQFVSSPHTKPPSPPTEPSTIPLWANSVPVPPIEGAMDVDEAIEVKREENMNWTSPRGSTSSTSSISSSGHGSLTSSSSSAVSELGEMEVIRGRDLGGLANVAAAADALVCSEKVLGMASLKPRSNGSLPLIEEQANLAANGLTVLASQASQPHHPFSTHGSSTTNSQVHSSRHLSEDSLIASSPPPSDAETSSLHQHPSPSNSHIRSEANETVTCIPNGVNGMVEEAASPETPSDENGSEMTPSDKSCDKEDTPLGDMCGRVRGKRKGSHSPEGKRKWKSFETDDEYESRRLARRAELNFRIDFSQLPEMTREERTSLIQQKIRELQSRWNELRTEVAYLERKKRKARRKEKEFARLQANQIQSPAASNDPSLPNPVECH